MAHTSGISTHSGRTLTGWEWASTPAGAPAPEDDSPMWVALPSELAATTVAAARRAEGTWTYDQPGDIDSEDHWFRCRVPADPAQTGTRTLLCFDGLATIADVWLDGTDLTSSQSMFAAHTVDVTNRLGTGAALLIRTASLSAWLKSTKRPRPRWKTRLVDDQHLRWARTALLGRLSSWGPKAPAAGLWQPVRLEYRSVVDIVAADVAASVDITGDAPVGLVSVHITLHILDPALRLIGARLVAGEHSAALAIVPDLASVHGQLNIPGVELWWPHTHGTPHVYDLELHLELESDSSGSQVEVTARLGTTGFRTIGVQRGADGEGFALDVNATPMFCRGAIWMPTDAIGLADDADEMLRRLRAMAEAGMNMVRLSGTTVYSSDAFHDACDRLGILVWQDLMLANLDVPFSDPDIRAQITSEIDALLDRHQLSPSLAVLCGSSELDQQATMMGIPTADVEAGFLHTDLPALTAARRPDVVIVASSPSGGHLPFSVDIGVGHYYGVGAYQRPLTDARHARVRFASECLAFANVPAPSAVRRLLGSTGGPTDPRWKAGVPRDAGAGWDFDDVRDHYTAALFGEDPDAVRYADPQRWFALGRATSAEVIRRTITEWRRPTSDCGGALLWFLNDVVDGAGWGLLDVTGRPKAAWYGARAAMTSVALLAQDEGVNGLDFWAVNDTPRLLTGTLDVVMIRSGRVTVASGSIPLQVAARGAVRVRSDTVIGRFTDPTYAYRFGPPGHDAVIGTWRTDDGTERTAFHFPLGLGSTPADIGLGAVATRTSTDTVELRVTARDVARFVTIDAGDATADDDHFHLAPGQERVVSLTVAPGSAFPARGYASALNSTADATFTITADTT